MQIKNARKTISDGKAVLSADIESKSFEGTKVLYFSYPEKYYNYLTATADPFFPAVLTPAMLAGEELEVIPEISEKILESQSTIQDIFRTWHPSTLKKINIKANKRYKSTMTTPERNATFFSLGVDSMYTMLKYLPANNPPEDKKLNTLIFIKGLELPLSTYSKGQDKEVIRAIERLASHYNLDAITGETNIRDVFPLDFVKLYLGPSLASVALSLSEGFKNIFIPSHYSYADLFPVASSPLLDKLWSNEGTTLIHDGSDKERTEKVAVVVTDSHALNKLRVCVCNDGGNYNCCKCWKCVRTMITLDIIDKLEDCAAFPDPLPKTFAKDLRTYNYDSMIYAKENLQLARKHNKKNLEKILHNEIRIGKLDQLREDKPLSFLLRELLYYFTVKTGRRFKLLKY